MSRLPFWLVGPTAAFVLLTVINLFNFIDRYLPAAVSTKLETEFVAGWENPKSWVFALTTAFLVSYTFSAPLFGWLATRIHNRWWIVGVAVIAWSLASGGTGLATTYLALLLTRCLIGFGEAGYTPVGLALISESYPPEKRGRMIALFYAAIPVGSALGYAFGTLMADSSLGWRWAFFLVVPPGLLLGVLCFFMRDRPSNSATVKVPSVSAWTAYRACLGTRSYSFTLAGYTAMTFVLGAIAIVVPQYVFERQGRYEIDGAMLDSLGTQPMDEDVRQTLREAYLGRSPTTREEFVERMPASVPARDADRAIRAASRHDGRYELTSTAWVQMGMEPLPAERVEKLRALQDQRFDGADAFKAAVRGALSEPELAPRWTWLRETARTKDSPDIGPVGPIFGGITVVAGLGGTLLGAFLAERLRRRFSGSELVVAGIGALAGTPFYLLFLWLPFPWAWVSLGVTVLLLFLHTGLVNAVFANVTPAPLRAHGFALGLLVMHALGDVISPPILGFVTDKFDWGTAFGGLAGVLVLAGVLWLIGSRTLAADAAKAAQADQVDAEQKKGLPAGVGV